MEAFVVGNWKLLLIGFFILEKIVYLTPKTWKPFGIPVGKYDDIIISVMKSVVYKIAGKKDK